MAKEEAKAPARAIEAAAPSAAKASMFSKAGMGVLLAGCAACAAGGWFLHRPAGGGDAAHPDGDGGGDHGSEGPSTGFKPPRIPNEVTLEPIKTFYRNDGLGGPRRPLSISVTLQITTEVDPGVHKPDLEAGKRDAARKLAVEKSKDWISNRILAILRSKSPEDFATNEMIEQVQQQIKLAINEELFGKQTVVQAVLFPVQSF